jgi:hypothetical protein
LKLGQKITDNFDDDKIDRIYNDRDFIDRSLLKIITDNGYDLLFHSDKVGILLEKIWDGRNTDDCDGALEDFSIVMHIQQTPVVKIPGKELKAAELFSNNFNVQISENKFWYQFQYRSTSISYIFAKDFLSATAMMGLF